MFLFSKSQEAVAVLMIDLFKANYWLHTEQQQLYNIFEVRYS